MLTEDYILRQISQLVAVLAKVAGLKKAGKYQQAFQIIDQTINELTGLDADIVKQFDDRSLISFLTNANGIDVGKLFALADLFKAEGDIFAAQDRKLESQQSYQNALNLFYELSTCSPANLEAEVSLRIDELQTNLGSS